MGVYSTPVETITEGILCEKIIVLHNELLDMAVLEDLIV